MEFLRRNWVSLVDKVGILLTKWYFVVNCGNNFYIFELLN